MNRQCGNCQLCCRLLPMQKGSDMRHPEVMAMFAVPGMLHDFDKAAGCKCPHQRHHKGCSVYATRPMGCRAWSCRWLVDPETAALSRPDRSHYVLDMLPDFIRAEEGDESKPIEVVQVWIDPKFPDAHRDPGLRAYLERQGAKGILGLVRFNSRDAILLVPPSMSPDGAWREIVLDEPAGPQWSTWPDNVRLQIGVTS